ncbi:type I-F CRISPR-associated helicase Cas3f [Legionella dresdenensis]|uniref:Type I-F CRISPR-associated helicase Cas3f n=1 Tax=Legionella dresdenensis TaxID=450200 RepID=A0ABV8CH70_9GAMM
MMVVFVSQCEKKALARTRRVLDAFADRIGDNTWQTVITQEGLLAVKKLLRKTASKNTAVSCHWIRSRARTELVWVVGNKNKFNLRGIVPVNSTTVHRTLRDDLADWHYLPVIQSLASLAALLHDWGKTTARFQKKLSINYKGSQGDALRHEWISCLLLKAFIQDADSDLNWLNMLANGVIDELVLAQVDLKKIKNPLSNLPPIAQMITWLIVTHHRLPLQKWSTKELLNEWSGEEANHIEDILAHISHDWGYWNKLAKDTLEECLHFPYGLITNSGPWLKEIKRWAKKLIEQKSLIDQIIEKGCYRPILHHARLCLMLGDHYFSSLSLQDSGVWQSPVELIANTQKDGLPKQMLDQHLVGVCHQTKRNAIKLPQLEQGLPITDNTALLKKKSPKEYSWQDIAANKIRDWASSHKEKKCGFFAVNMASTGCGKTFANAKMMLALSENNGGLRYILALGLRTLTLQTGNEYRERIFHHSDGSDLAVLIGSKAIVELHNQDKIIQEKTVDNHEKGSDSRESLIEAENELFYDGNIPEDGLDTILPDNKARKLLYAPILVCTIDHVIAATETTRGGRYILPCLRLMSSDLVIDEVDDFTDSDAIAIGRLIHLAGMLGRKVMISSATIPPSLAEGYFNCYREGWQLYTKTRNAHTTIACAWIDEFNTVVVNNEEEQTQANNEYSRAHQTFIKKRVDQLSRQFPKRKADIIDCQSILNQPATCSKKTKQSAYFNVIFNAALAKHQLHYQTDHITGLQVSFGVIRIANIAPCIALTRFFLDYDCPSDIALRVMPYHSQQVLLLRHEQEKHLDHVLKHKEKPGQFPVAFEDQTIRNHLDLLAIQNTPPSHVLFILVATPVEEVGRDHDFDWAIVEPSSYRSIIQLGGRVRRHRKEEVYAPNIGLLQYNWKTIQSGEKEYACYFSRPGYEFNGKILVNGQERRASCYTHNLKELVNEQSISERLDAIPRIDADAPIKFGLALLEHAVTSHWLKRYDAKGPETLQGYLTQHWYLTALPQALNRFRSQERVIRLFRYFKNNDEPCFIQKDEQGYIIRDAVYHEPVNMRSAHQIRQLSLTEKQLERIWLLRDYKQILSMYAAQLSISLLNAALRYGELVIQEPTEIDPTPNYRYNDQIGLFKENQE